MLWYFSSTLKFFSSLENILIYYKVYFFKDWVFTKQIISHNKIKFILSNIITVMPGELEQFCRSFITPSFLLQQDVPENRPLLWPLLVSAALRARGSPCPHKVPFRLQPCATALQGIHSTKHRQTVPCGGEVVHRSSTTVREAFPTVGLIAAFSAAWYK